MVGCGGTKTQAWGTVDCGGCEKKATRCGEGIFFFFFGMHFRFKCGCFNLLIVAFLGVFPLRGTYIRETTPDDLDTENLLIYSVLANRTKVHYR